VAKKEIAVKKCVVKLSAEERDRSHGSRGQELGADPDESAHCAEG
jgi:hypothetical protein